MNDVYRLLDQQPASNPPEPTYNPAAGDINTMQLADEELQIDDTASAFDFPPPPLEAGNPYRVKLLRGERGQTLKIDDGSKDGRSVALGTPGLSGRLKHVSCHLELRVLADNSGGEAFKDAVLFDNATTASYGKSCRAFGIAREALGLQILKHTHLAISAALWEALASEPQCRVNLQWRAYCKACNVELSGERNFPQKPDGSHAHVMPCRKCGNDITAQARPTRYLPL